ncbi:alpha-L-rhamnosidase C-terminal domain-containing protein [Frankia sp. R43]|uniref:alpha-L-rhamnosidase C-terminal domain-containing protein n=1 Tax=Frankia sp. R43 TaxID=269536 RepID=UPI00350EB7C2
MLAPGWVLQDPPLPGRGLDWAKGALETRSGRVECVWRRNRDQTVTVHCAVLEGLAAELHLPDGSARMLEGGSYEISLREDPQR